MAEKEYIGREAVNNVLDELMVNDSLYNAVQTIPAADVVEVVHCSQCTKWHKQICGYHGLKTEYYDYCSYGERKDGSEGE